MQTPSRSWFPLFKLDELLMTLRRTIEINGESLILLLCRYMYLIVPVKYVENVESYFWNSLKGMSPLSGCSLSRRPMRSLSCITSSLQPSLRWSWLEMFRNVFLLTQFSRYVSSSLTPLDLPTLKEKVMGKQLLNWIFKNIFHYNALW